MKQERSSFYDSDFTTKAPPGGPDVYKPCIFPFKFSNNTYFSCTMDGNDKGDMKAWCPTKVDDSGNAMIEQGYWGYCQPECATSTSGLWENKPDTTTPSTTFLEQIS